MKKILKIFIINIFILILGIIILEIIFGNWLKNSNYGSLLIPKKQINVIKSFPYNSNEIGIYSRDKDGFRANEYELENIEILIIGGSTTEEREVDDNKIWTKIFEKNLNTNLKVLNAGIGGQTSYGHKLMFNLWFNKFENLSPKYIIVYLGITDALFLLENYRNNNFSFEGRNLNLSNRDTLQNILLKDRLIQYIKNNSALHTLYLIIRGNLISRKHKFGYNTSPTNFKPFRSAAPKNISINNKFINEYKKYYYDNLKKINEFTDSYDSDLILVTQIVSDKHWLQDNLKIINKLTTNFCIIEEVYCIDLSKEAIKINNTEFYDGIHTTPKGSQIIGKYIADKFNILFLD